MKEYLANPEAFAAAAGPVEEAAPVVAAKEEAKEEEKDEESDEDMASVFCGSDDKFELMNVRRDSGSLIKCSVPRILRRLYVVDVYIQIKKI